MIAESLNKTSTSRQDSPITVSKLIDKLLIYIESSFDEFVENNSQKRYNEEYLTQRLVILLLQNGINQPFVFIQENKEKNSKSRVDIGVYPREKEHDDHAFFVIEAKRLPSPPPKSREKEYVIGDKNNGAIERFKRKRHGANSKGWAVIGYLEQGDSIYWHKRINKWITELTENNNDHTIGWDLTERLKKIKNYKAFSKFSCITNCGTNKILMYHYFLNMQ